MFFNGIDDVFCQGIAAVYDSCLPHSISWQAGKQGTGDFTLKMYPAQTESITSVRCAHLDMA
jgi:hypothetical protein